MPSLDDTLIALAHPTRRAILDRLSRGEQRVTDIAERFDCSLNTVSKHIRVLERARLVRRRHVGREHLLSRDEKPLDEVARWIDATRARWEAAFDRLEKALKEDGR
jgi:DNA-binding transcriptional ArsR family regulator